MPRFTRGDNLLLGYSRNIEKLNGTQSVGIRLVIDESVPHLIDHVIWILILDG